jgi:hypothetical protein
MNAMPHLNVIALMWAMGVIVLPKTTVMATALCANAAVIPHYVGAQVAICAARMSAKCPSASAPWNLAMIQTKSVAVSALKNARMTVLKMSGVTVAVNSVGKTTIALVMATFAAIQSGSKTPSRQAGWEWIHMVGVSGQQIR